MRNNGRQANHLGESDIFGQVTAYLRRPFFFYVSFEGGVTAKTKEGGGGRKQDKGNIGLVVGFRRVWRRWHNVYTRIYYSWSVLV